MRDLLRLYEHNTWANTQVFDLAAGVDLSVTHAEAPGTRDTVAGTLAHLAGVEYAYLRLLRDDPPGSREEIDAYLAHDLRWFRQDVRQLGAAFAELIQTASEDRLERPLRIPWFSFELTAREGLLQVLTHSAQHRSQVLSWLSAQGVQTPDLDYVIMLQQQRAQAR